MLCRQRRLCFISNYCKSTFIENEIQIEFVRRPVLYKVAQSQVISQTSINEFGTYVLHFHTMVYIKKNEKGSYMLNFMPPFNILMQYNIRPFNILMHRYVSSIWYVYLSWWFDAFDDGEVAQDPSKQ